MHIEKTINIVACSFSIIFLLFFWSHYSDNFIIHVALVIQTNKVSYNEIYFPSRIEIVTVKYICSIQYKRIACFIGESVMLRDAHKIPLLLHWLSSESVATILFYQTINVILTLDWLIEVSSRVEIIIDARANDEPIKCFAEKKHSSYAGNVGARSFVLLFNRMSVACQVSSLFQLKTISMCQKWLAICHANESCPPFLHKTYVNYLTPTALHSRNTNQRSINLYTQSSLVSHQLKSATFVCFVV